MAVTGRLALLAALGIPLAFAGFAWLLAWNALILLAAAVDAMLAGSPRALTVRRSGPPALRLGEQAEVTVHLRNNGSRTVRGIARDAWVPSAGAVDNRHRVRIPAGREISVRTALLPTRRGERGAAQVTVRSIGPLGLAGRQAGHTAPLTISVLPPFTSRRHLPSRLARLRDLDGRNAVRARGQGTEFDALREYVPGDDVRSIDWRATARSRDVMIRTWRPERDRRIIIVLDTGRTSAARVTSAVEESPVLREGTRLDASMDAALLLAALARRAGDRVDLLAFDTVVRADIRSGDLPDFSAAMARLEPELLQADGRGMVAAILGRARQRSLVVLLTALDPAALEESLLPVLAPLLAKHTVVLASASDPATAALATASGTPARAYAAAASAATGTERHEMSAELNHRGVHVIDTPADRLAPALADAYLALKASGRL